MGFDIDVGLFLCTSEEDEAYWPAAEREKYLDEINATLRRIGLADHREPRSLAEVDPPLLPEDDPCLLGASMGSYSSHSRRVDRLEWLAWYVAVHGVAPSTDPPYEAELCQAYETLPDRRLAFDHLLAACREGIIVLPRPLERVMSAPSRDAGLCFVSADRLRAEAVALGFVLRYPDPADDASPVIDWTTETPVQDQSFADLDTHIADDPATWQHWAEEHQLCYRLLTSANDVLRTGALALTS